SPRSRRCSARRIAEGYRVSGFVQWHIAASGFRGMTKVLRKLTFGSNDSQADRRDPHARCWIPAHAVASGSLAIARWACTREVATVMFSHVTIGTQDFSRAVAFSDAVLEPLGIQRLPDTRYPGWASWQRAGDTEKLWVGKPQNGQPASHGNGWMVAFTAPSRAAVDAAHAAAIACGGTDEGPPGLRLKYATDYYGAYVRDPEGNKLHFVTRGD